MMIAGQPGRGGRLPETKPRSAGAAAPARVPPVAAVSSRRPFSQPENRTSGSRRERIRAILLCPALGRRIQSRGVPLNNPSRQVRELPLRRPEIKTTGIVGSSLRQLRA